MNKLHHVFSRCLFWLALLNIVIMTASQLFGHYVWQLELFSHYVPYTAVFLLLAAVFYPKVSPKKTIKTLPFRSLRTVYLLLGLSAIFWSLQPLSLLSQQSQKAIVSDLLNASIRPTTLYYQNVNISNEQPQTLIDKLMPTSNSTVANTDIIALIEAGSARWATLLAELARHYPTHCGIDEASPFAMQIYAKDTQATCEIITLEGVALARLTLANSRIVYVAHPPPPINGHLSQARNDYLHAFAKLIPDDYGHKIMVVGDFNTSAFSPIYRDFVRRSSAADRRLEATTINGLPTWIPFGIGIDHVLAIPDNSHVQTQAQGWHGSDHRGFLIEWK